MRGICKNKCIKKGVICSANLSMALNGLYLANSTLLKLTSGSLKIRSDSGDWLEKTGPSLIFIEKNQTIKIKACETNEPLNVTSIAIPCRLMTDIYALFIAANEINPHIKPIKNYINNIFHSDILPGMAEAFDDLILGMEVIDDYKINKCFECNEDNGLSAISYSLMFILSAFIRKPGGINILSRSIQSTTREKTYNIIRKDPSRIWTLDDVAKRLFMSQSSLKRKLTLEGTSFSEVYLDVRMYHAATLLRTGKYNSSQVAQLCGYNSISYFITTFKKYFNLTPYVFMKMFNI